jgi:uncharacterized integral membrane protein
MIPPLQLIQFAHSKADAHRTRAVITLRMQTCYGKLNKKVMWKILIFIYLILILLLILFTLYMDIYFIYILYFY